MSRRLQIRGAFAMTRFVVTWTFVIGSLAAAPFVMPLLSGWWGMLAIFIWTLIVALLFAPPARRGRS
jgi:hypothetical protein